MMLESYSTTRRDPDRNTKVWYGELALLPNVGDEVWYDDDSSEYRVVVSRVVHMYNDTFAIWMEPKET